MNIDITNWGGLLLSQEHITERSKQKQWIRMRESIGAYYSIINDIRLTDKEVLESTYEWIH